MTMQVVQGEGGRVSDDKTHAVTANISALKMRGLAHLTAEDERSDGRTLTLGGSKVINFGSCSYLGLEVHPSVKAGAFDALDRYGTQFSSSRAYVSAPLYGKLDTALRQVFQAPGLVIAPTTTLGHAGALPVLVGDNDAVIYDLYAHNSLQSVLPTLKGRGISCEPLPHNRIERLVTKAKALAKTHDRVFYLCDGVYSMHGDILDVEALYAALDEVPELFGYVDDAHGLGWAGARGAGIVLGNRPIHKNMAVTFGLSKGMASAGGALVFADQEIADRVFMCGNTLIFSGPIQPPMLGAAVASAKVLLSDELPALQDRVRRNIQTFDDLCAEYDIPSVRPAPTPIRFVEIGSEDRAMGIACGLKSAGYFVNTAVFPAVARGRAGLRIMLGANQTEDDVRGLSSELLRLSRV
jgi:7-keto-8-aminopelargonate synthetase-like enzyme